jgi:DNA-binding response OmpR family regulator
MLRTVLIVEDAEFCTEALELALESLPGIHLRCVKTAEDALASITTDTCAVVTDINLPKMNGFELIEALRADPLRSNLAIMVISADSDPDTPARVAALGADAYFAKPFSPTEVRHRLEQLIHDP